MSHHRPRVSSSTTESATERVTGRSQAGFTLIEILVVVLLLSILVAVAIPLYMNSARIAAERTVRANIKIVAQAAQSYRVQNGVYPLAITNIVGSSGMDVEQSLDNAPPGVTYTVTSSGSASCTVTASEGGNDVFGDGDNVTGQTIAYEVVSGSWTGP